MIFGYSGWVGAVFFVSFVVIHQFVLVQVVVAVLLDKILPSDGAAQPTAPSPSEPRQLMEASGSSNAMLSDPVELPKPSQATALEPDEALGEVDDITLAEVLEVLREDLEEFSEAIEAVCKRKAQVDAIMDQQSPEVIAEKVRQHFKEVKRRAAFTAKAKAGEGSSGWW